MKRFLHWLHRDESGQERVDIATVVTEQAIEESKRRMEEDKQKANFFKKVRRENHLAERARIALGGEQ